MRKKMNNYRQPHWNFFILLIFFIIFFSSVFLKAENLTGLETKTNIKLILATGSKQGIYYQIGLKIADALQKHGINVKVVPTAGSVQNIKMLLDNKAQLCIAQTNILKHLQSTENIKVLIPLYTETMHILIRNPIKVRHLTDLSGKRISVGPLGGGTEPNAIAMLEAAGISKADVFIYHLSFDDTAKALQKGDIDAAFIMIGDPAPIIETLMKKRIVTIFAPDTYVIEALLGLYNGFVLTNISSGTYTHQYNNLNTIGIPALLLARANMDNSVAKNTVSLIMENLPAIFKETGVKTDNYDVLTQLRRIDVEMHPGAKLYFENKLKSIPEKLKYFMHVVGIPIIIGLLIIWVYMNWPHVSHFYRHYPETKILFVLITLLFAGTTIMYFAEHAVNDNYATWGLSFWSTFVNWINFGSKEPITTVGRINSTIMTILGLGGLTWLASEVVSMIIMMRSNEGSKRMKNHFVLINWNEKGNTLIKNFKFMQDEIGSHTEIVVVSKKTNNGKNDVLYIHEDPLSPDIVNITNMKNARSVIIMSMEDVPPDEADTKNILIVFNIAKHLKGIEKKPHIVLEICSPENVNLINEGDLDVEVVSTKSIASDLLVQVAANPGLTGVYNNLLTNAKDSSEIYSVKLNPKWYGKSFDDICKLCADMRSKTYDILPLAIKRGAKTIVNPSTKSILKLREGDILFAVCDNLKLLNKLNNI
jgi:hypothetical protein